MTKLYVFLRSDGYSFGYRPEKEDIYTAIENINNGILYRNFPYSPENHFAVIVEKVNGEEFEYLDTPVFYDNPLDAVFNIDYPLIVDRKTDFELAWLVMSPNSISEPIRGVFKKINWVSEEKPSVPPASQLDKPLDLNENKEFMDEMLEVARETQTLTQLVDTSLVEKRLRKHLIEVRDPIDVYADLEETGEAAANLIHKVQADEYLPRLYDRSGNILLHPYGAVLRMSLDDKLVEPQQHVNYYQAVLYYLDQFHAFREVEIDFTSMLNKVLVQGLSAGIYEIAPEALRGDVKDAVSIDEVRAELNSPTPNICGNVNVLLAVLSTIISNNFFEVSELGVPLLTQKVSRIHFAEMMGGNTDV